MEETPTLSKSYICLSFRLTNGSIIKQEFCTDDTIALMKDTLAQLTSIPAASMSLVYGGRILKDDYTVAYYGNVAHCFTQRQDGVLQGIDHTFGFRFER
jgi:hypothetical protein